MARILAFQSNAACSNVTILKTCQTLFTHFVRGAVLSSGRRGLSGDSGGGVGVGVVALVGADYKVLELRRRR